MILILEMFYYGMNQGGKREFIKKRVIVLINKICLKFFLNFYYSYIRLYRDFRKFKFFDLCVVVDFDL